MRNGEVKRSEVKGDETVVGSVEHLKRITANDHFLRDDSEAVYVGLVCASLKLVVA